MVREAGCKPHASPLQNRKARSSGSLTAVRKRTMDGAPTMPRASARAMAISKILTLVMFSRTLDLNMS